MNKKISLFIIAFFSFQAKSYGEFSEEFLYQTLKKKTFKNKYLTNKEIQNNKEKKEVSFSLFEPKDGRLDLSQNVNIEDLSFLQGSSIISLNISGCEKITDLTPLKGLSLKELYMNSCHGVRDFGFLKGLPLQVLDLSNTEITDLTPLIGMPLHTLYLRNCPHVKDIRPLRDLPLIAIYLNSSSGITDISPLDGKSFTLFDTYDSKCYGLQYEKQSTFHQRSKKQTHQRPTILQKFSSKLEREG